MFSKFKKEKINIKAFCTGELIDIENVNDQIFSTKMMGDGCAIIPAEGKVYAPCDGTVTALFEETNHAIGITLPNQMEILLHCGIDTVNIKEKMFSCNVKKGDTVKTGDLLITYNKDRLQELLLENIVILVILNKGKVKDFSFSKDKDVYQNQTQIIELK